MLKTIGSYRSSPYDDVRRIACQFMEDFGDVGFGLGSQVSHIDALMVASLLDHFIKEQLHIKYYGRYMDDFYLIHENREYLKYCMGEIRKKCKEYGFVLNEKWSQILENEVFPERNWCGHSQDEPKITGQDAEETQNIPKEDR